MQFRILLFWFKAIVIIIIIVIIITPVCILHGFRWYYYQ